LSDPKAFVDISARAAADLRSQLAQIRQQVLSTLKSLEKEAKIDINVDVDSAKATALIDALTARVRKASAERIDINADVDLSAAEAKIAALKVLISNVEATSEFDLGELDARAPDVTALRGTLAEIKRTQKEMDAAYNSGPQLGPDRSALANIANNSVEAKIEAIDTRLRRLRAEAAELPIGVDATEALTQVDLLQNRLVELYVEHPQIQIGVDLAAAQAEIAAFESELQALSDGRPILGPGRSEQRDVEQGTVGADLDALEVRLAKLRSDARNIPVGVDADKAIEKVDHLHARLKELQSQRNSIQVSLDLQRAEAELVGFEAALKAMRADLPFGVDMSQADIDLAQFEAKLTVLKADLRNADQFGIDTSHANSQISLLEARIAALKANSVNVDAGMRLSGISSGLQSIEESFESVDPNRSNLSRWLDGLQDVEGPKLSRFQRHALVWSSAITAAFGAAGVGIGAFAVKASADLEQVRIAFGGIQGSQTSGNALVEQLRGFAAETPYEFDQLTAATQKLLAAFKGTTGIKEALGTDLFGALGAIGDLAATLGRPAVAVDRFVLALTQMSGKGRVAAEEVRQMAEAFPGFNAYAEIARIRGISVAEAMTGLREKTIPFDEAMRDLVKGMQTFNGAAGAMERQSQTLAGRLSTVKDQIKITLTDSFAPLAETTRNVLESFANSLTGGPIQKALDSLGVTLSKSFSNLAPSLLPFIESLLKAVDTLSGSLLQALIPIFDGLGSAIPPLAEVVGQLAVAFGESLGAGLSAVTPLLELLAAALNAIPMSVLTGLVTALAGMMIARSVVGPLATFASSVGGLSKTLGSAGSALGTFWFQLRNGALTAEATMPILGLLAIAFGGVVAAWSMFNAGQKDVAEATRNMTQALEDQYRQLIQTEGALDGYRNAADGVLAKDQLTKMFTGSGEEADKLNGALGSLGLQSEDVLDVFGKMESSGGGVKKTLTELLKATGAFNNMTDSQIAVVGRAIEKTDHMNEAVEYLRSHQIELTDTQLRLAKSAEQVNDSYENVDMEAVAQEFINARIAESDATAEMVKHAEANVKLSGETVTATAVMKEFYNLLQDGAPIEPASALAAATAQLDSYLSFLEGRAAAANQIDMSKLVGSFESIDDAASNAAEAGDKLREILGKLNGKKLDVTDAIFALEELKRGFEEATVGGLGGNTFNPATEDGKKNYDYAKSFYSSIAELASAQLAAGMSESFVDQGLGLASAGFIKQMAKEAGVSFDEMRIMLESKGIEIPAAFVVDEAARQALLDDIEKVGETQPEVAVALKALVDAGKFEEAQYLLDSLSEERITALSADPAKFQAVVAALLGGDIVKAIELLGDTTPVDQTIYRLVNGVYVAVIDAEANPTPAEETIYALIDGEYRPIFVNTEANTAPAAMKIGDFVDKRRETSILVDADTSAADAKIAGLKARARISVAVGASVATTRNPIGASGTGGTGGPVSPAGMGGDPFGLGLGSSPLAKLGNRLFGLTDVVEFRQGGILGDIANIAPHIAAPKKGGHMAIRFAEAGFSEAFISTDPKFRDRSKQIHQAIAPAIGMESIPRGEGAAWAHQAMVSDVARQNSAVASEVRSLMREFRSSTKEMVEAMLEMPPITVQGDSAAAIASDVYWRNRERSGRALAATVR
jgi:tape measure domain-containing protein